MAKLPLDNNPDVTIVKAAVTEDVSTNLFNKVKDLHQWSEDFFTPWFHAMGNSKIGVGCVHIEGDGSGSMPGIFGAFFRGIYEIEALAVWVLEAADSGTFGSVKIEVNKADTYTIDLCAASSLSGIAAGDILLKTGNAAAELSFVAASSNGGLNLIENAGAKVFYPFVISTPDTYSFLNVVWSGDVDTDIKLVIGIKYHSLSFTSGNHDVNDQGFTPVYQSWYTQT